MPMSIAAVISCVALYEQSLSRTAGYSAACRGYDYRGTGAGKHVPVLAKGSSVLKDAS
jgi:hypothetical protein